jgi:phospholipase C
MNRSHDRYFGCFLNVGGLADAATQSLVADRSSEESKALHTRRRLPQISRDSECVTPEGPVFARHAQMVKGGFQSKYRGIWYLWIWGR